ncbi:hypothetical protein BU26DRAFT_286842 [Trematosphaeria pertusa]|uniref:Aminoglycoside phosphotransferase domain-containing protein n=1 Tax=Trematosphaeria pertusa TaxID=390896 RepID=A0A6A6IGS4_9PLEO|nr:uncharacterized protein BU26DRAFT_286842 [Trematosphaeria pertusa]KAF2249616.1 hypothetical protein BU26DRAFT_286842 [Trematosphaeria pertusa]
MAKRHTMSRQDEAHIIHYIKQISANSWLIGDWILTRSSPPLPSTSEYPSWIDEADNASYAFTSCSAPRSPPPTTTLDTAHIKLIYDCSNFSAVFSIGTKVMCKISVFNPSSSDASADITHEADTLSYVCSKQPNSFTTPRVIHSFNTAENYAVLIMTRVAGRTLASMWKEMSEGAREACAKAVVAAIEEMMGWESDFLGGVNGKGIQEPFLVRGSSLGRDDSMYNPLAMHKFCEQVGMGMQPPFVFYHADLGPTNVLVLDGTDTASTPSSSTDSSSTNTFNSPKAAIGIIDFEVAGFLPKDWIMTKFCVTGGMDLSFEDDDKVEGQDPVWWRMKVATGVRDKLGLRQVAHEWAKWKWMAEE